MSKPFKITAIHAFIAIDADGDEGVAAFMHDGMWHPMVATDERRLEQLRPIASELATACGRPIKLCRFSYVEEIDSIEPKPIDERFVVATAGSPMRFLGDSGFADDPWMARHWASITDAQKVSNSVKTPTRVYSLAAALKLKQEGL